MTLHNFNSVVLTPAIILDLDVALCVSQNKLANLTLNYCNTRILK